MGKVKAGIKQILIQMRANGSISFEQQKGKRVPQPDTLISISM